MNPRTHKRNLSRLGSGDARHRVSELYRTLFAGSLIAIGVVLALMSSVPALAQQTPPTLATYEGWLREAFAAAQRSDRLGLEQVAPQLTSVREIALDTGVALVDNSWLTDALAEDEPDLERISQRLGALIDALGQPAVRAPDDATQRLEEMLSRPPFAQQERSSTLLGDLLDWLLNLLERLFAPLGRVGAGSANAVGWLATILGGVLIIGVLGYVLLKLRRNLVSEASSAHVDPEANLTSVRASQQAAELARGGDYRTAVRYLYLSALLRLDERDVLRYDRALTNREYLVHLRNNSDLYNRLLPIVETFDRVWYGYAQLDAQSFDAYRQQVEALRQ